MVFLSLTPPMCTSQCWLNHGSQRDSKSNTLPKFENTIEYNMIQRRMTWATELCVMIQLQPSHIASLWKLCVGSDNLKTVEVEVAYKDGHVDVS